MNDESNDVPARRGRRRKTDAGPDPVDVHVGARIRARRSILRMSQSDLAAHLGMTFQNVQKYERGENRISASVLWRTAQALAVPVTFFFEGLGDNQTPAAPDRDLEKAFIGVARLYTAVPTSVRVVLTQLIEAIAVKKMADRP